MAKVIIDTPNGEINYDVTMMQISDFTIDSIFENKLYLMIPFYIFNYEKEFKKNNLDKQKTEALANVFRGILNRLDIELEKERKQLKDEIDALRKEIEQLKNKDDK